MGCAGSREEKRRSRHHHDTDDVSMSSGTDPLSSVPDRHRRQSRARSANSSPRQRHMDPPRHDAYRVGSVDHTPASVALSQQLAERGSQRSSAGRGPSRQSQRREPSPPRSPIDGNVALLLDEIDDLKAPSIGDPAEEPTDVMRQATEADIVSRAFAEHGITAAIDQFAASQQSMNVNRKGGQKRTREWLMNVEASNYGLTPQDPQLSASPNSQLGSPGMRYMRNDITPAPLANFNPASFAMTPEQPSIAGNSTFILHSAVFAMNQSEMTLPGTVADTVSQGSAMSADEHKMPRQARTRATLGKQPTFVHRMTTSAAQTPAHGGAETPEPDDVTATFRH